MQVVEPYFPVVSAVTKLGVGVTSVTFPRSQTGSPVARAN